MPTINLSQKLYNDLQDLMAQELTEKVKSSKDPKQIILLAVKKRYGITFQDMIQKLYNHYVIK